MGADNTFEKENLNPEQPQVKTVVIHEDLIMKNGIELITEERERQMKVEGWTPEHDDEHTVGELAMAASCYAMTPQCRTYSITDSGWPWDSIWWKPTPQNRILELQKAGALIAAEIDRLQRKKAVDEFSEKTRST